MFHAFRDAPFGTEKQWSTFMTENITKLLELLEIIRLERSSGYYYNGRPTFHPKIFLQSISTNPNITGLDENALDENWAHVLQPTRVQLKRFPSFCNSTCSNSWIIWLHLISTTMNYIFYAMYIIKHYVFILFEKVLLCSIDRDIKKIIQAT